MNGSTMAYRKVVAIIPAIMLDKVETALIDIAVPGITVSTTHGFGDRDYFARDAMTDCVRIEIFSAAEQAEEVVQTIAQTVNVSLESAGIIAVLPVEKLLHIRELGKNK